VARIRNIKHDLYLDEDLAQLPIVCRYAFPGLWTLADREGRLEDRPARIKAQLFPYEPSVNMDDVLARLAAGGFVLRYEVAGVRYLQVRTFAKHQQVNARESPSKLPAPPSYVPPDPPVSSERTDMHGDARACTDINVGEGYGDGNGIQGMGDGEGIRATNVAAFPTPPARPADQLPPEPHPVPRDAWLALVESWNAACRAEPAWTPVTTNIQRGSQGRLLRALQVTPDLDAWDARFARAASSDHLTNRNGKGFVSSLWWLLEHVDELDAGQYDNRRPTRAAGLSGGGAAPRASGTVKVTDPDVNGQPYRFDCSHHPPCTTWPQCRDHGQAARTA